MTNPAVVINKLLSLASREGCNHTWEHTIQIRETVGNSHLDITLRHEGLWAATYSVVVDLDTNLEEDEHKRHSEFLDWLRHDLRCATIEANHTWQLAEIIPALENHDGGPPVSPSWALLLCMNCHRWWRREVPTFLGDIPIVQHRLESWATVSAVHGPPHEAQVAPLS